MFEMRDNAEHCAISRRIRDTGLSFPAVAPQPSATFEHKREQQAIPDAEVEARRPPNDNYLRMIAAE